MTDREAEQSIIFSLERWERNPDSLPCGEIETLRRLLADYPSLAPRYAAAVEMMGLELTRTEYKNTTAETADALSARLHERSTAAQAEVMEKIRTRSGVFTDPRIRSRQRAVRTVLAAAAVFTVLIGYPLVLRGIASRTESADPGTAAAVLGADSTGTEDQDAPGLVRIEFVLSEPGAQSVALAGSFSNWELIPLQRSSDGEWRTELEIEASRIHSYNFVIDGTLWIPDPSGKHTVRDDFGGEKTLLHI